MAKVEKMTGAEVKEEVEEPEWEMLVSPEAEALRTPGITMVSSPTHVPTFSEYIWAMVLWQFFFLGALLTIRKACRRQRWRWRWGIGSVFQRAGGFWLGLHLVRRWVDAWWMPVLLVNKAQGYSLRYFSLPSLILLIFLYVVLSVLSLIKVLMITWSFPLCFSVYATAAVNQHPQTRSRSSVAQSQSVGGWRPPGDRVCCCGVRGWSPLWCDLRLLAQLWSVCVCLSTSA